MKHFNLTIALLFLCPVTTVSAELVDVTLKGTLNFTTAYSVTRDSLSPVELEYINSFDIGSTFEFTFRYDSASRPTSSPPYPLSPQDVRDIYTTGVSLRNGRVGTFTDFNNWQVALTLATFNSYGGYDAVQFELTDPTSGRFADLEFNWNVLGAFNGRDVFIPSVLPDAKTLDGVVQQYGAQFGVRYSEFVELYYQKAPEPIERISAVAVVPESTSAMLCLSSLIAAAGWRRRV